MCADRCVHYVHVLPQLCGWEGRVQFATRDAVNTHNKTLAICKQLFVFSLLCKLLIAYYSHGPIQCSATGKPRRSKYRIETMSVRSHFARCTT